jgi:hypothetical protein
MKPAAFFGALIGLILLTGSCTMQVMGAAHARGKVLISSVRPGTARALGLTHPVFHKTTRFVNLGAISKSMVSARSLSRSASRPTARTARNAVLSHARDLSAATDVASMSYTVVNTNPSSGESPTSGSIDPTWPYIDLFLTPGQTYTITVDVVLTPVAPGYNVGVTHYGDQATFYVDPNADTYVDLYVHPTQSLVLHQQISGTTATRVDGSTLQVLNSALTQTPEDTPEDKFFYSTDGNLFYFNAGAGTLFQWKNISTPINTTNDVVFNGATLGTNVTLYAVCPESGWPGYFVAIGQDTSGSSPVWYCYEIYWDGTTATLNNSTDITIDVDLSQGQWSNVTFSGSPTIVPTGISTDPDTNIYLTFYETNTSNGDAASGLIQFSFFSSSAFGYFTGKSGPGTWNPANDAIFTDALFDSSTLYVLASPIGVHGSGVLSTTGYSGLGQADILMLDNTMTPLGSSAFPQTFSTGTLPALSATTLSLPNRFASVIQNGKFYLSQYDFTDLTVTGSEVLSKVSSDLTTITAAP